MSCRYYILRNTVNHVGDSMRRFLLSLVEDRTLKLLVDVALQLCSFSVVCHIFGDFHYTIRKLTRIGITTCRSPATCRNCSYGPILEPHMLELHSGMGMLIFHGISLVILFGIQHQRFGNTRAAKVLLVLMWFSASITGIWLTQSLQAVVLFILPMAIQASLTLAFLVDYHFSSASMFSSEFPSNYK